MSNSLKLLNIEQSNAYQIAIDNFVANDKQLIMFISGESGTGKTMLANKIAQGAQCLFNTCKREEFNKQSYYGSVICTAPTGIGAFKIEGHLWQTVLEKPFRYFLKKLSAVTIKKLQDRFKHVKVFILDEVNLVSLEDLQEINFRLCTATGDFTKPFGGLHIVMLGDFYQLHAKQGTAIVRRDRETFNTRALQGADLFRNEMTHYVCLTVNQKRNGLLGPLAAMVRAAREKETSSCDLKEMNTMVLDKLRKAMRTSSSSRIWIEDRHKKGNEMVNRYMLKLELELRSEVLYLIAYHKPTETWRSRQLEIATKKSLFSIKGGLSCGGDFLSRPLIAPLVIDVRVGLRVRLTANILPCAGLFHGAVGTVVGVIYRGEGPNHSILSCLASKEHELPMVLVRMDGDDDTFPCSCMNDVSRVVPIIPVASKQRIVLDNGTGYIRYQIPIIALSRTPTWAANSHGHSDIITGQPDFRQSVNAEYDRLNSTFAADSSKRRML